jgi:hypothetical protein
MPRSIMLPRLRNLRRNTRLDTNPPGRDEPLGRKSTFSVYEKKVALKIKKTILQKIGRYEKLDERRHKKVNVRIDFKDGALVVKKA